MLIRIFALFTVVFTLMGCSVFGDNGVESAPYSVLQSDLDGKIEVREYEPMILVSASMEGDGRNNAFRKLFKYITGNNQGEQEIAMTAPVFMDDAASDASVNSEASSGSEIAMTAPVFMDKNDGSQMMSFVMPKDFTLATTPIPIDPDVKVSEVRDYKVVAIRFAGTLSDTNVEKHTKQLSQWMKNNGYEADGKPITAGYNGPLTLPWFRHNEVLVQIN